MSYGASTGLPPRKEWAWLTVNGDLEGSLDTVTAHRRFLVTVTPESNDEVTQPTHEPIFSSDVECPE